MLKSIKSLRLYCLLAVFSTLALSSFAQESEAEEEKKEQSAGEITISETQEPEISLFSTIGSHGYYETGAKTYLKSPVNNFFLEYGYFNYDGYRQHSLQYHHDLKSRFQTMPSDRSKLTVTALYQRGAMYFPGSLTEQEFKDDPCKADQRSIDRNEKKIYSNGRMAIDYSTLFGKKRNNSFDFMGYGRIDINDMATKEYRIFHKYRVGAEMVYKHNSFLFGHANIFSAGAKFSTQPGRIEYYENFGGIRNVDVDQLMGETSTRSEIYASDIFSVINKKLDVTLGAGYQYDRFGMNELTQPSREETRNFHAVTPDLKLEYHPEEELTIYISGGLTFSSPEDFQLESPYPAFLFNQNVDATLAKNIEAGFKGDLIDDTTGIINKIEIEGSASYIKLENEIISYEVYGDYFFRNAAGSQHFGIDLEGEMKFFRDFDFRAGYHFAGYEYLDYHALSLEEDSLGNLKQIQRDFSDKTEPGIPAHRLDLSLKYDHKVNSFFDLFAGVGYIFTSKAWADDNNSTRIPSYELFNVELGMKVKAGHFEGMLSGEVHNAFDKKYVSYINVNSANRRYFYAGAPSSFFVNFTVTYLF